MARVNNKSYSRPAPPCTSSSFDWGFLASVLHYASHVLALGLICGSWLTRDLVDRYISDQSYQKLGSETFFRAQRRVVEGNQVSAALPSPAAKQSQTSQTGGHKQAKQVKNNAHATNQRRLLLRRNHRGTHRRPAPRPTTHATKRHAYPTTTGGRDTGGR